MKQLREIRKKAGLTQEKLAELIGVSRSTVTRWENENIYPDVRVILRVAQVLQCNVDSLLPEEVK